MLLTNKHFTPVIGLDIHIVILLGFPVPLPHPYIGFVIDPMDYIPFIGATTKINHVPRGKSDTSGIIIILFHIPMGGPFLLAPMIAHDSVNFYGSKKVKVEGNMMSPSGHMLMTCNDIGMPLSLQPGKKMKPIPSMYLPTSFSIPVSFGKPVMVGGPFVPDWEGVLLNLVMSYGFGALMKGAGKLLKGFNKLTKKVLGESNKLSKLLCHLGFEPVDLIQGIVVYDGVDFELPGPIPIKWERSWNSDCTHDGLLGHGTQSSYDLRVQEYENMMVVLLGDGRSVAFEDEYNRHEKKTLTKTGDDEYQLFDHQERLFYHFSKLHPTNKQYRLYLIRNESGFMISFHYNAKGYLVQIIDSVGRHLHIENTIEGRMKRVTVNHKNEKQSLVSYGYNEEGDLSEITDALDQTTHIQYRHHLMVQKTDRNGQTFYWEYEQNRCTHTWGDGGIMEGWIEYHPKEGYNLVTNALGKTTTYYYTPDFVVTQIKDPLGYSTFFEYTEHFEIYRITDEEGNITGYTYDEHGNCVNIEKADGSTYTFNYNKDGRIILATNPQGGSRSYIYHKDNGLLHTITETDGRISIFRYDNKNLLNKIENELEHKTLLEYDEDYNLCGLTLPDGGHSSWKYDSWGRCVKLENPLKQVQYFQRDALGRITAINLPDGNNIKLQYNAYEEVLLATDKYHKVRYFYTPMGSLKVREENGSKVHYIYNKAEQLTGVVNEHGETYRLIRNERGDIIQESGFDGVVRHYELDGTGKIIKVRHPNERWTEYEYDYNGRLTRAEYSDGSWETYSYNRNGHLLEAVNEYSTIQFQRDEIGRVLQEVQNGHVVNSTYGPTGRRTAVQSGLGARIQSEHSYDGHITGMIADAAGIDDPWTMHIQRNILGLEIERSLPGGLTSRWRYDKSGMPTSQTVQSDKSSTGQREYRWDASQRLRQIVSNSGTANFNHDDFGNLAWVQYENGVHDYRLQDKVGNIYKTPGKKDRKYEPGGKVIESDKARFQYDPEGNLIRKISGGETWGYEWYSNGMLKSVVRPDGKVITFRYDALGRRIEKEFNGQLTRFIWDGNVPLHEWSYPLKDRPVTEVDELGNVQQNHAEPVPEKTLVTWIFEEGTYVPVAKLVNGKRYSIVTDHLGTPYEAYDETGEKIWQCELDIYGKVRKLAGDKTLVPFRYQGQYEDIETGLYYNRFRYYSPEEGIYISQDPVKLWGGNKLYAYVHDPNIYCDVLGLTGIPFGFNSFGQFKQFGEATQGSLTKAGYPNATPYMQGSAVTGRSFETKVPFDVGRTSDFDLAIAHSDLYKKAESLGLGKDGRTGPIKMGSAEAKQLGVDDMLQKLSRMSGGREVNTMIFKDAEAAKAKAPSIRLPTKCH